ATLSLLGGCGPKISRYVLVEDSLRAGDATKADQILERSEKDYGSKSQVLYHMDRGMTLQLAGRYQDSNAVLEQAEEEVDRLYTRHLRTETKAFLINDTELTYEGDSYEQVMINVLKAVNYALMGAWNEALVEARRIDHRLNVLSDRVGEKDAYRNDAFARYLSGIIYEATGDLNNAFIAYRNAYEEYRRVRSWSRTPIPPMLRTDLLRVTDGLHLIQEHEDYRREFADITWQPIADQQRLAQIIVIDYNGRAPRKEDQFIDLPISLDALKLVLLTKGVVGPSNQNQDSRAVESVLYGLSGRVVRVALPRLIPQKTQVAYGQVSLSGASGSFSTRTELAQNLTAIAEKTLSDRFASIAVKSVARAAVKYSLAEGVGRGAQAAAGKDAGPWVGLLAGALAKTLAVASEEADKRSWRTLPDEVQVARLWVPSGDYELRVRQLARDGGGVGQEFIRPVTLQAGETKLFIERVLP
ncbi:MAG TPA: hypothetical protein VFL31_00690, partial [Nitrospiraceae bacterium]|nr:hypothetical protein [Nitrospiraceae bacterium]